MWCFFSLFPDLFLDLFVCLLVCLCSGFEFYGWVVHMSSDSSNFAYLCIPVWIKRLRCENARAKMNASKKRNQVLTIMTVRSNIKVTTLAGFEPTRDKPNRFLVGRLNHSAIVSNFFALPCWKLPTILSIQYHAIKLLIFSIYL